MHKENMHVQTEILIEGIIQNATGALHGLSYMAARVPADIFGQRQLGELKKTLERHRLQVDVLEDALKSIERRLEVATEKPDGVHSV